jgi:predicted MFS family arabinose efflux permease
MYVLNQGIYTPFSCIGHYAMLHMECSEANASLLLSLLGVTNTVGRVVSGFLSDLPQIDCVLFHNVTLLIAGIITCFLPLFYNYGMLCFYLIVYGPTIG